MQELFSLAIGLGFVVGTVRAQSLMYVDADAPGPIHDGLSWCSAYVDLSVALLDATDGLEIRVAEGAYTPDRTGLSHGREATFKIPPGVKIAGGYAGCGSPDAEERDPALHETILSGDLDRDDHTGGDPSENSYHTVWASNSGVLTFFPTVIEGFTITAGHAGGLVFPTGHSAGGGIHTIGNVTVTDCVISNNRATIGGGMFNLEGSPIITGCTFRNNEAVWGGALALYGFPATDGTVHAGQAGIVAHGDPQLAGCVFVDNRATDSAGALWVHGFQKNPTIVDCVFSHNLAGSDGGALFAQGTVHRLYNCLFGGNQAGERGGAVFVLQDVNLRNCTFADNLAASGGGLYTATLVRSSLTNCILWGNAANDGNDETAQADGEQPLVDHACIQGWTGAWGGDANSGADPLFVPGPGGCYYLSQVGAGQPLNSPCVDAGSISAAAAGLHLTSTRFDEVGDSGMVDLGYHFRITGREFVMGDSDADGLVDMNDFAKFQTCFAGDGGTLAPPCCRTFDLYLDGTVDSGDFVEFLTVFAGD